MWTTGMVVPVLICIMQPMFPEAITSGDFASKARTLFDLSFAEISG